MKDFFTTETTVKINVATIDGKKITKSIFNQINTKSPFNFDKDKGYIFEGGKILGYVFDKEYWLLWVEDDKIYKSNLGTLFKMANLTSSSKYSTLKSLFNNMIYYFGEEYLNSQFDDISYEEYYLGTYEISQVLSKEAGEKLKAIVLNSRNWKLEILNHQIFL